MDYKKEILMLHINDDGLYTTYYMYDGYINQKYTTNTKSRNIIKRFRLHFTN